MQRRTRISSPGSRVGHQGAWLFGLCSWWRLRRGRSLTRSSHVSMRLLGSPPAWGGPHPRSAGGYICCCCCCCWDSKQGNCWSLPSVLPPKIQHVSRYESQAACKAHIGPGYEFKPLGCVNHHLSERGLLQTTKEVSRNSASAAVFPWHLQLLPCFL